MPGFTSYDPEGFADVFLYEEAAHIFLAYYYGFEVDYFAYRMINDTLTGSVKVEFSDELQKLTKAEAYAAKARQLLAGQIATRIRLNLNLEEYSYPLPGAEKITGMTPARAVLSVSDYAAEHDAVKAVAIASSLASDKWWSCFWQLHAETTQLLHENWKGLERLVEKLYEIKPFRSQEDRKLNRPSGGVNGEDLIKWCHEIGFPKYDWTSHREILGQKGTSSMC